ncbi:CAP domain-containing protein [Streptomyces radicis]|uniref:CAP domain-containing protein n=2 Tax=Streptomyces radicis TaxID=1750517 RepID=A0A3A9W0F1_9ACTN|nr:CAP domain-containing protein [Streptomyces radicis]RKN19367.1 CAP domain-containing protein [Streptomyces radicis]
MGRHRRRRRRARTGLIGASAALTVGAVAMGTGLLPGAGDGITGAFRSQDSPSPSGRPTLPGTTAPDLEPDSGQGTRSPDEETTEPTEETTAEATPDEPTDEPSSEAPQERPSTPPPSPEPSTEEPPPPPETTAPAEDPEPGGDAGQQAAEAVLALVNEERANAGCRPLTLDAALTNLAIAHSRDMAERGYFDHTDPDGRTPWDRAAAAGVSHLGGENIARGQPDARAVMDAWMASEGHRANILNCDYTTLGVGAHFADGGPWWTQNFGF